jgi:hypothetical protein
MAAAPQRDPPSSQNRTKRQRTPPRLKPWPKVNPCHIRALQAKEMLGQLFDRFRDQGAGDARSGGHWRRTNRRHTTLVGDTNCPECRADLADGHRVAGRRSPGHHDVTICRECGEIVVLTRSGAGLALRSSTASEYLSLPQEAQSLLRVAYELVQHRARPRQLAS